MSQPGIQFLILLGLNVLTELFDPASFQVHPWHFLQMGVRFLVVFDGKIIPGGSLIKLGSVVVGVLEVDAVILFRYLDCLLDLGVTLADLAVHVKAAAVLIEAFGLIHHAQLDGHHSQLCLNFRFLLGLTDAASPPRELHVADAYFGHIEALALDAHDSHLLPDSRVLDILDTLVGLVEIARGEMERKVEDGVLDDLIVVVDALEVVKSCSLDQVVLLAALNRIEVRDLQGKDVECGCPQYELVLVLDACLVCVEKGEELATGWL